MLGNARLPPLLIRTNIHRYLSMPYIKPQIIYWLLQDFLKGENIICPMQHFISQQINLFSVGFLMQGWFIKKFQVASCWESCVHCLQWHFHHRKHKSGYCISTKSSLLCKCHLLCIWRSIFSPLKISHTQFLLNRL